MSFWSMLLGVNDEEGLPGIVYFKGFKMQAQEARHRRLRVFEYIIEVQCVKYSLM